MIRSGKSIRLTAPEVDTLTELGIDTSGVRSPTDFAHAVQPWMEALHEVRPDILDKLVREIARAKGMELPPELTGDASDDSPGRS